MKPYRRILLILTEVEPTAALYRAMALAQTSGVALHVLGIHEPGSLRLHHELQEAALPAMTFVRFSTGLEALLDEQPVAGIRPTFEAVDTSMPGELIPAYLGHFSPDLVIVDCGASSVLDRVARTSFDHTLLHASAVPVLFVPPHAPTMPGSILVAVDVSRASLQGDLLNHALVAAGQRLVAHGRGQLHLISAYDLPLAMLANPNLAQPWADEVRESLRLPFDALADAHGIAHAHRHFSEGAPLRTITSCVAALEIDVVVVGVVQPRRWAKLIGDTTERLINHPPCSILTLRCS